MSNLPATPDRLLVYKTLGEVALKLHLFQPAGCRAGANLPGIVFFFGGGWNGGTPTQFYPHCRYLAERGMLAMAAEYRVRSVHGTTPFESVADAKSAMRWLKRQAKDLGLDPERLAAGGGSAGGHLAAATALVTAFDEAGEDCRISPRPSALVLFNPAYDNGPGGCGYDRVQSRWQEFSPIHNIRAGAPPSLVFLGTEDHLISVAKAEEFQQRLAAVGSRSELFLYPGQKHGFFNFGNGSNPYFPATLREADRFLASLGYLTGPPRLPEPSVEVLARPSPVG